MKVLVTKASSDYWYDIKDFNTIKDIEEYIEKYNHSLIIGKNNYTTNDIFKYWDGMKKEDIPIIKKCSLNIQIYDYWIE